MAKSLNKVQILGNLGKGPDVKVTASGTSVATFSVATGYRYQDQSSNEWKENTEWHNVVAWKGLADVAGKYLHKGSKCYIEGRLQTRSWDDKDGKKHYMTEIVAQELILLDGKGEGSGGQYAPHPAETAQAMPTPAYTGPQSSPQPAGDVPPDDSCPF